MNESVIFYLAQVGVPWIQLASHATFANPAGERPEPALRRLRSIQGRREFKCQRAQHIRAGLKSAMAIWNKSASFSVDTWSDTALEYSTFLVFANESFFRFCIGEKRNRHGSDKYWLSVDGLSRESCHFPTLLFSKLRLSNR